MNTLRKRPRQRRGSPLSVMATLVLLAGSARAGDDVAALAPPARAAPMDVQTTASIVMPERTSAPAPASLKAAIAAYRRGALSEGDAIAASLDDTVARPLLEWVAIRSGTASLRFSRLDAFLRGFPDYPASEPIRRMAEAALLQERKGAAETYAFFQGREPLSPAGRLALARALKAEGRLADATALARRIWLRDTLHAAHESLLLADFPEGLTAADHKLRAERLLFAGQTEAALRNAARVSKDHAALIRLRIALSKAKGPLPEAAIAKLPASLKDEPSLIFLRAQQARHADKADEAVQWLSKAPKDAALLGDGDGWWTERRLLARKLLDAGQAATAYRVAAGHAAEDAAETIEAEWHAGFIALRFMAAPERALVHFRQAAAQAETPISVSRTAYWEGRALEAMDRPEDAEEAFARAAEHSVAYYGQLARARLGQRDLPIRRTPPAALEHLPGQAAVRLLYDIGEPELARRMLIDLAQRLHTTPALEAVAAIVQREGDVRTLLAIGKTALQRGFPLDAAAFPIDGVPSFDVLGDPMERAIVHAIARQESAFDPTANSPAGARGLMQMMPATARETARRAALPFDWARLGQDAHYAARMGAAHLNDLLVEWRGSYVLAFAAYNAGSGNVRRWIGAYGDPRRPEVDAVDWVERIPFSETRNYVQRVMENLQVYRQRLDQRTAYVIDEDLKRGGPRE